MQPLTINKTQLFTVYNIDTQGNAISKVNIVTEDFSLFTAKLLVQDLEVTNKRSFKYARPTTELAQIIESFIVNSEEENFNLIFESKTEQLAKKLLDSQIKSAKKHPGINSPKEGSLVVIYLIGDGKIEILISKIDQAIFLNLEDSLYKSGLPVEKATQKSCSISYQLEGEEYQLVRIDVSDSTPKIANFWYDDFLELEELNTNESNTRNAFNAIDNVLTTYVKSKSKKDYNELRNSLTGYFQTKSSFKFDDMIEYVIGEYTPESEKINIGDLKSRLSNLPSKKNFDTSFDITVSEVKGRFKRSYKISDKIELRTANYIEDLKNIIVAKEDGFGKKVLEIRDIDDEVYNTFKIQEE